MFGTIGVQCPYCGVQAKIRPLPPGILITGLCPRCKKAIAIFCGQVLVLDKNTMKNGFPDDRREHIISVLTGFLLTEIESKDEDLLPSNQRLGVSDENAGGVLIPTRVQCPHCQARGEISVSPVEAMIIGPCPGCRKSIVIFCSKALALDEEIMKNGSMGNRKEHLRKVLTEFLRERVENCLSAPQYLVVIGPFRHSEEDFDHSPEGRDHGEIPPSGQQPPPISDAELERFTKVELGRLDDKDFFKRVFETPPTPPDDDEEE